MQRTALLLAVVSVGCGGGANCSKDSCSGPYLISIDQTSGTCSPFASGPSTLDQCIEPSPYCPVSSEAWSSDSCTVTRTRICYFLGVGTRSEQVWSVTQSETGDTLTGTLTTTQSRMSDGAALCTGSYTVTGTRQ
jgi:hypothetical protein